MSNLEMLNTYILANSVNSSWSTFLKAILQSSMSLFTMQFSFISSQVQFCKQIQKRLIFAHHFIDRTFFLCLKSGPVSNESICGLYRVSFTLHTNISPYMHEKHMENYILHSNITFKGLQDYSTNHWQGMQYNVITSTVMQKFD